MKKVAVLFNPSSGRGRSLKEKGKIEKILQRNIINYDLIVTESEDHLRQLAAETARQYEVIVGVGGDTTFNIIASEILKYDKNKSTVKPAPAMGMIGTGSANDIARGLGIEKIEDACKAIKNNKIGKMDVGYFKVNGKSEPLFFLGTVSLGLGATVNRYVEGFHQRHKILSKMKPFDQLLSGLYAIYDSFSKKKVPLQAEIEYQTNNLNLKSTQKIIKKIEFSLLVFLNTPYYANGLRLVKNADTAFYTPARTLFDGLLDCCIIYTKSFLNTLKVGIHVQKGTHMNRDEVTLIQSNLFKISSKEEIDIQVDGEIFKGVRQLEVSLIPKGLTVLI
jgi:diacylglycerol kinase (ATP)